jgi:NAD(P)H dehydrogenase (quinone)
MILITGATGNLGKAVIEKLLHHIPPQQITALVRDEKKAGPLRAKGINISIGDYESRRLLLRAFKGIEKLLLIASPSEHALDHHKHVVKAAMTQSIPHIFYTSGALNRSVEKSKLGPLYDSYITTENWILHSGMVYTIFRSSLYAETLPLLIGKNVRENGIYFPAEDGRASFAGKGEIGEAIANAMIAAGHENKIYLTTGQQSHSFSEIAAMLSEITRLRLPYKSPDISKFQAHRTAGGDNPTAIAFASLLAGVIENGELDVCGNDLAQLLGREPTDLKTYLAKNFNPSGKP